MYKNILLFANIMPSTSQISIYLFNISCLIERNAIKFREIRYNDMTYIERKSRS